MRCRDREVVRAVTTRARAARRCAALALAGVGVVLAGGTGPIPSAQAAPAACQGLPATITSDGGDVVGTEGDDVISTTGFVTIEALGGNDVICLSDGEVEGGAGDDSVELDVADVTVAAVRGGDGRDTLKLVGPQAAPGPGEGTAMYSFLFLYNGNFVTSGQVTFGDFEKYSLDFHDSVGVGVYGTSGPDHVELIEGRFAVALYEGDDRVDISGWDIDGSIIDAGDGTDSLWSQASDRIDIRLGSFGGVAMDGVAFDLRNFEDAVVEATRVRVVGTGAANRLVLAGCIVKGSGRGGDDTIRVGPVPALACPERSLMARGGRGEDRLVGSRLPEQLRGDKGADVLIGRKGADTLVGGAGRDRAVGGGGRDICRAEVEVRCEADR